MENVRSYAWRVPRGSQRFQLKPSAKGVEFLSQVGGLANDAAALKPSERDPELRDRIITGIAETNADPVVDV